MKHKNWTLQHGKIANPDGKFVIPKCDIFKTLCEAHSAIAHRGKDKTEHYIRKSYLEISQQVITLVFPSVNSINSTVVSPTT